jgi:hypothetical protein
MVRTTLSLDDDVAALLRRAVTRRKEPVKKVLNDALREGLPRLLRPRPPRRTFRTRPLKLGRCLIGSIDDIAEVLAIGEGEAHK